MRKVGDRLRLNAQLIQTETGKHVWAERFDRDVPLAEIFNVQNELAAMVVGKVASQVKLHEGVKVGSAPPEKLDAYDLTVRAFALNSLGGGANVIEARRLARLATVRDPTFARAWRMLATTESNIYATLYNEVYGVAATANRGFEAAARAVELAPNDALNISTYATALRFRGEFERADAEYAKALARAPHDSSVLLAVANGMRNGQRYNEAERHLRRALALDSASNNVPNVLARVLYQQRKYIEAARIARDCLLRAPTSTNCTITLAAALGQTGPMEAAREAAAGLMSASPGFTISDYVRVQGPLERDMRPVDHTVEGLRKAGVPE